MKKSYVKFIMVMTLILLMLGLNSCASKPKKERSVTLPPAALEGIYFPTPPDVEGLKVIPLDKDMEVVQAPKWQIEYIVIPYSLWKDFIDYVTNTEKAVSALYRASRPPDETEN